MAKDIDCTREHGPWHGRYVCRAHFREEAWWLGRLEAWVSLACSPDERFYFWRFRGP